MTDEQRQSFKAQAKMWRERAERRGCVVTHAIWQGGQLRCETSPRRDENPQAEFVSRRGARQEQLSF